MSSTSSHSQTVAERERQASQAQRTAEAKVAFVASLNIASNQIDSELQERAKNIHNNQEALTKQDKELQKQTKELAKQSDSMEKFVAKSSKQLAAFDDYGPLTADLDRDLADLEEILNIVEQGEPSHEQQPDDERR